ncbi:hypothetical protein SVIOM74S_07164 [Streptomyces violarus]
MRLSSSRRSLTHCVSGCSLPSSHRPATTSQLAAQLDAKKGNVAHHLKVLREAALVHIAGTRQVRGGTEQY